MNGATTQAIVERFLRSVAGGDADEIAALFADDIDWYLGGNPALPWTGRRTHRTDVSSYFRTLWSYVVRDKGSAEIQKLVVAGEDAIIFAVLKGVVASTGAAFETPVAFHLVVRSGVIGTLHLYEDTWLVSNAFAPNAAGT